MDVLNMKSRAKMTIQVSLMKSTNCKLKWISNLTNRFDIKTKLIVNSNLLSLA